MSPKLKHYFYQYYVFFLVPLLIASTIAIIFLRRSLPATEILLAIYSGSFSLIFFIQKQHLEELRTFKEVFKEFNHRYDKMNEDLYHFIQGRYSNDGRQLILLFDYFNLCGEEYLYYRKGIIYPEVWKAWSNGILFFLGHPRIREIWESEQETDSYYGLTLEVLEKMTGREIDDYSYTPSA